jgi:two-component system NtrC family sensor kinase
LRGDPVKFLQIISNLVMNALDAHQEAADSGRFVDVTLSRNDAELLIKVTDNAAGIAAEALPLLFDEFYTTKAKSRHGLGIGLAIVKQHVTVDFAGSINVISGPGGTQFSVTLPLTPKKQC